VRFLDSPYTEFAQYNRAGFNWQSDYSPRAWTRTSVGYNFVDEHGEDDSNYFATAFYPASLILTPGLRRNHGVFAQEMLLWKRFSLLAGVRYEHNESFGGKTIPRATATYLAWRGNDLLSGTRLRAAFSEGIVEPSFAESYGSGGTYPVLPNPNLHPEQARTLEAGLVQNFDHDRFSLFA
jgi:outer membrane receptor protein involved in Fe transport